MAVKRYQLLEHTADISVRIFGRDLKALFRNSAIALFEIISQRRNQNRLPVKQIAIKKSAENIEELLIAWLSELISLSDAENLIFDKFKINKLTDKKIEAVVSGMSRDNFRIKTEIKAATYHELKIEKAKNGWQAQVIFDV